MGPDLRDGEAVTTQCSLRLCLYTVKNEEAHDRAESVLLSLKVFQCFAKNMENGTFSELPVL